MNQRFTQLLWLLFMSMPVALFAQPANDDCGNATSISCGTALANQTTVGATGGISSSCLGSQGDNVWYTFVGNGNFIEFTAVGTGSPAFEPQIDIYASTDGTCATNNCVTGGGAGQATVTASVVTTAGTTYYVAIGNWINGDPPGTFDLSVACTVANPPVNDLCSNATPVTLGGAVCGPTVTATNTFATGTAGDVCGSTSSSFGDGDIWFSFTAGAASAFLDLQTGVGSLYISVYDECGGNCVYGNDIISTSTVENITGLTAGNNYLIRMYESGNNSFGNIEFCMFNPPPPPANDECAGATPVTLGNGSCGPLVTANNGGATGTSGDVCNSTSSLYGAGDIWFSFEAGGTSAFLDLQTGVGSLYISVYDACGGSCVYNNSFLSTSTDEEISGLTPGNTYYIRMYESGNNSFGTIEFCMFEVLGTPANDLCADAQPVSLGNLSCGPTVSGSNINATDSGEGPVCGGGTYAGGDVFYSFVAGGVTAELDLSSTVGSLYGEVYGGSCGSLSAVYCSSLLSLSSNEVITGLVAGETYYLRLFESGNDASGSFEFCMFTPPPPPVNDVCSGAIPANVGANMSCPTGAGAYSEDFSQVNDSGVYPQCDLSGNFDLWYTWTATASSINFTSGTGAPGFAVWQGACGSLTELGCLNNLNGTIGGLVIGEEYYLEIWDDTAGATSVEWCLEAGPTCGDPSNLDVDNITSTTADVTFASITAPNTVEFGVTGFTPGTGTLIAVASGGSASLTGLDPNTTYDVYVTADCSGTGQGPETFTTRPLPPANDLCSGAIVAVFVNPAGTGCGTPTVIPFDTDGTTDSGVPSVCSDPGNDQYFTWTATSNALLFDSESPGSPGIAVYASCADASAGNDIDCGNTFSTTTVSGWNIGQELIIQIYDFQGSQDDVAFCLEEATVAGPPSNDACDNAIALTDAGGNPNINSGVNYSTASATASAVTGACTAGTPDNDVWFAITAPSAGFEFTVTVDGDAGFDPVLGVFTGSCLGVAPLSCEDATASDGIETYTFTSAAAGAFLIQVYDYSGTGTFTIDIATSPLPVELTSFTARATDAGNVIEWTAALEEDLYMYTVERAASIDAIRAESFQMVSDVAPKGTQSGIEAVYSAIDASPAKTTYYRLRAEDLDGTVEYSDVVAVVRDNAGITFDLMPNPAHTYVNIRVPTGADQRELRITDLAGRVITSLCIPAEELNTQLDLTGLQSGLYTVTVTDALTSSSMRLVID